ncbi:PREDICTED: uncharacterized protein LOC109164037 [Ipomoea nil]|uniref:uncharacterized protein LOC109164037 n=1 Tax=Ipomoea nil TaxID=35883 RepID=UPI00090128D9|nr:PREDICTED: uncharacterized protein LOC109164037 [Ipomoea nil]
MTRNQRKRYNRRMRLAKGKALVVDPDPGSSRDHVAESYDVVYDNSAYAPVVVDNSFDALNMPRLLCRLRLLIFPLFRKGMSGLCLRYLQGGRIYSARIRGQPPSSFFCLIRFLMRFLVWNVRGVASQGSFHRIRVLLRSHSPSILCLLEPFSSPDRLGYFQLRFSFDHSLSSCNNKIWLFWNNDLSVSIEGQSDQCISVACALSTVPSPFWISFVYAKTKERLRVPLWDELHSVSARLPVGVPWSVAGDFNCLLSVDEKKGGLPYPHRRTTPFRDCVSTCDLIDVTFYGSCFTWWNGRRKEAAIWMRLDRCLYTSVWDAIFKTSVRHLSKATSDHSPLLISCDLLSAQVVPKHFIFLNVWAKHGDFQRVVRDNWLAPVSGAPMYVLATKLNRLAKALSVWSKEVFGNIFARLKEYEDRVQALERALQQHPDDDHVLLEYKEGVALLQKQVMIEEEFWQQKARITEVQEGERNSHYFHSLVKERRRKLFIHRVRDDTGQWIEDREGIAAQAVSFFEHMFTAEIGGFDTALLDCVPQLVTEGDNDLLTVVPEEEEIKAAVFQMSSVSAAGPDGFSGAFYKACWDIIRADVVLMV